MSRTRKIALLGAKGYEQKTETELIDCFLWKDLSKIRNVRDYDDLILDLLPIKDKMTEKINQPMMSLTMAPATITIPIFVLNKSISIRIRTTTGKAVIDIAVPIKSENRSLFPSARPKNEGKKYGITKPKINGTTSPSKLILIADFPCENTKCNSTSSPAMKSNKITAICTIPSSARLAEGLL